MRMGDRCLPPEFVARGVDAPLNSGKRSSSRQQESNFWDAELAVTRMGCGANLIVFTRTGRGGDRPRARAEEIGLIILSCIGRDVRAGLSRRMPVTPQ